MIGDSRNEKKLKAALRAKFRLKQTMDRIDHEHDVVLPAINDFKGKAVLPEPPDLNVIDVEYDDTTTGTAEKP